MALFLLLILSVTFSCCGVDGRTSMFDAPGVINPIESGDVGEFDCVDIYKQPAFDHPLLKNHKIQMNPSFSTERMTNEVFSKSQLVDISCPQGMVPIHKTKVEGQTHLRSFSEFNGGSFHTFAYKLPGEYSVSINTKDFWSYHGASAIITVNNPRVKVNGQYSKAQIWLRNGPEEETNSIEVGWAVHPQLYGDNRTRLTAHWTADGYQKTGCYNALCPGYVQVHPRFTLGGAFSNISVYDGQQYGVNITINQDQSTGNWWLIVGNNKLGYWPKGIFTHLATGALYVRYGGATFSPPDVQIPVPMGNGLSPDFFPKRAGFFSRVQVVNADYNMVPIKIKMVHSFLDIDKQCYFIVDFDDGQDPSIEHAFTFGGPGGPWPCTS